jgi:hypothetical protein
MVATDADVALRRIDVTNPGAAEEHNIQTFPHVKVYNRGGSFVGIVVGLKVEKVKSYVAQAKNGSCPAKLAGTLALTQIARPLSLQS